MDFRQAAFILLHCRGRICAALSLAVTARRPLCGGPGMPGPYGEANYKNYPYYHFNFDNIFYTPSSLNASNKFSRFSFPTAYSIVAATSANTPAALMPMLCHGN